MKRLIFLISLISILIVSPLTAQLPINRTTTTVIADALSQLPAKSGKELNQILADLILTGEEGILQLVQLMNPDGSNKSTVEFALSGWTSYAATNEELRKLTAGAYRKALEISENVSVKRFIIRQLELIGDEESIAPLAALLSSPELADPAAQALVSIGSPDAEKALLNALKQATPATELIIINAIGQTYNPEAEPVLLEKLADSSSGDSDRVILTALSKCGGSLSIAVMNRKVAAVNYTYEKSNALDAYIVLLGRLVSQDYEKAVEKPAKQLLANATRQQNYEARVAAMNILMQLPSTNKALLLKSVLNDDDKAFVNEALNIFVQPDKTITRQAVSGLSKKNIVVQEAVLYWLGNTFQDEQLPVVLSYFKHPEAILRTAAIRSATKIGGADAVNALFDLLKSEDNELLTLIENSLLSMNEVNAVRIASAYNEFSEKGKLTALTIISSKKASDFSEMVMREMESGSPDIRRKSAGILKNVVTENDLKSLIGLLEKKDQPYTPQVQEAVIAALSTMPAEKQLSVLNSCMTQSASRELYYPLLLSTGSKESLRLVATAYHQTSGKEQEAAFRALITAKEFDAIYLIMDILKTELPEARKQAAVNAVIRLSSTTGRTGEVQTIFLREMLPLATDRQKADILAKLGKAGTWQGLVAVASYLDNEGLKEAACQAVINIVLDKPHFAGTLTTEILEKVMREVNNPDAGYQRDAIRKYLNENPREGGFVSLFDGKSLAGWKGLVGNPISRAGMAPKELKKAQDIADKAAAESWIAQDGELYFTGKGDNLCTEKQYGDFELYVDWKLYPGDEPDAGIYLRGTPQVQIWDTARVTVGAGVGSGGLYNNKVNPSTPLKVADLPVGTWNTFFIKMKGDRVSVYLNGQLVTNNVILENYWDRKNPIFGLEQLELQAHGSKVAYRDIFIREIERPEPFKLSAQEEKEGFEVLFDGTNMHKWTGNTTDYVTEDGNIVLYPSTSFGGNLFTKEEFGNFIFRFEFQLTPGANNGLGIRTPMEGDPAYVGMELQILDDDAPIYSKLKEYQYHGSVYGIIPAKRGHHKPMGEWNYQEVIANGNNIKITLNGTVILEGNLREATKNGTLDGKEHPGLFNEKGHIGFLGHGSNVKFRNIRVKRL